MVCENVEMKNNQMTDFKAYGFFLFRVDFFRRSCRLSVSSLPEDGFWFVGVFVVVVALHDGLEQSCQCKSCSVSTVHF